MIGIGGIIDRFDRALPTPTDPSFSPLLYADSFAKLLDIDRGRSEQPVITPTFHSAPRVTLGLLAAALLTLLGCDSTRKTPDAPPGERSAPVDEQPSVDEQAAHAATIEAAQGNK